MYNGKIVTSVYHGAEETKMMNDIRNNLTKYGKISRSQIFVIALKEMYDRLPKEQPKES